MRRPLGAVVLAMALLGGACGSPATVPSPTPPATPTVTTSPAPTAVPTTSPTAGPSQIDHALVYFARDMLPPIAGHVAGAGQGATAEARVLSRLAALFTTEAPRGLFNTALQAKARPSAVSIAGEVVTVDFAVAGGDWGVAGSTASRAFLQQLVYTSTEEPGIRSVLITENGGQAIIGGEGIVIDHPATREDVAGYDAATVSQAFAWRTEPHSTPVAITTRVFPEFAPAMARFVIDTGLRGADAKASLGVNIRLMRNDERAFADLGKWTLSVSVPDARTTDPDVRVTDAAPIRAVRAVSMSNGVRYDLGLDDARPWRVAMSYEPLSIVIDYGGEPNAVSANIALYQPTFGATVRPGQPIAGLIRAFEARYEYRWLDARGTVLVSDFATASLGTAEMWGVLTLAVPDLPPGPVTLELRIRSPRDGSVAESVFTSVTVAR
jgi:immunoglobulin-like protein involved in spore germination/sporulation and spore germination protein